MKVQEENHTSAFSLPGFLRNWGLTERAQWPPLTEQWSWVHSSCLHSLWPPHSGIYMAHQLPSRGSMVGGHVWARPPCTHASGHGKCMPYTLLFPEGLQACPPDCWGPALASPLHWVWRPQLSWRRHQQRGELPPALCPPTEILL